VIDGETEKEDGKWGNDCGQCFPKIITKYADTNLLSGRTLGNRTGRRRDGRRQSRSEHFEYSVAQPRESTTGHRGNALFNATKLTASNVARTTINTSPGALFTSTQPLNVSRKCFNPTSLFAKEIHAARDLAGRRISWRSCRVRSGHRQPAPRSGRARPASLPASLE
jgi:hypothetical protein